MSTPPQTSPGEPTTPRRVVAVHAHPDDESLFTGGTLASLAARGVEVTVVTCTLGEEGEVIGDTYSQLVAGHADQLGGYRIAELRAALKILGVQGCFLGGAGHYRDSGMVGSPAHANPRAFVNSGPEAVEKLVALFEDIQPELVLTYGPDGGYGHPDHIRAHEITMAAAQKTGIACVLWCVNNRADHHSALDSITQLPAGWQMPSPEYVLNETAEDFDFCKELSPAELNTKERAMAAHATQLIVAEDHLFALSNLYASKLTPREFYQLGLGSLEGIEL